MWVVDVDVGSCGWAVEGREGLEDKYSVVIYRKQMVQTAVNSEGVVFREDEDSIELDVFEMLRRMRRS
jgi:hypothetical protein